MAEAFDPYHKWLGIPPSQQPPHHYRLLGLELYESDPGVIDTAASQRMSYLQELSGGEHVKDSQRLLNEVSSARRCLLDAKKKAEYDTTLRTALSKSDSTTNPPSDRSPPEPDAKSITAGTNKLRKAKRTDKEETASDPFGGALGSRPNSGDFAVRKTGLKRNRSNLPIAIACIAVTAAAGIGIYFVMRGDKLLPGLARNGTSEDETAVAPALPKVIAVKPNESARVPKASAARNSAPPSPASNASLVIASPKPPAASAASIARDTVVAGSTSTILLNATPSGTAGAPATPSSENTKGGPNAPSAVVDSLGLPPPKLGAPTTSTKSFFDLPPSGNAPVASATPSSPMPAAPEKGPVAGGDKPTTGKPTTDALVLDLGKNVSMKFVKISAGKFKMGVPADADKRAKSDQDEHEATITRDFWIGALEVTQAQYEAVAGANPMLADQSIDVVRDPDHPLVLVSFDECLAFCEMLSTKSGKVVRLPTEEEWEYACRAGSDDLGVASLEDIAWHQYNSEGKTHPVGSKTPNAWGLFDMLGNAAEWTYSEGSYGVIRGGSWKTECLPTRRELQVYKHRNRTTGLRLVVESEKLTNENLPSRMVAK